MSLSWTCSFLRHRNDSDIKKRVNDGMPETLPEWINDDGLTHLKIKLNRLHPLDKQCYSLVLQECCQIWEMLGVGK